MKKFFYLMACVAIAGFGFTSCGDDDDTTPGGGSSANEVRAPKTEDFAAIYSFPETEAPVAPFKELDGKTLKKTIKEIEVTEDEHIIFTLKELPALEAPTRAAGEESWCMYKFTKNGDTYKVVGFGTIIIVKDGEGYLIELRPNEGETAKATGKYRRSTRDALTKKLCLTWTIESYRVQVSKSDSPKVGTGWKSISGGGCDFQELIDYANKEHNAGIKADLGKKQVVEGITFTGEGTFLINYKNTDEQDVGNWKWENTDNTGGTVKYLWRNPNKMGNDFLGDLGGEAIIRFDGKYCRLTLIGQVDRKSEVSIDFKLK